MSIYFWLDDNPDRQKAASNMSEALNVDVKFHDLKKTNLDEYLTNLVANENQPSLIILDQNLENANRGIFIKGSTVATYIRESWPECPIICITGEDIHNLNIQQKSLYEDVYLISKVSDHYCEIQSIAEGFKTLKANWPEQPTDIISLLKAPDIDLEKLKAILPTESKGSLKDYSAIVDISRWVRDILMRRPGFLYNSMWLSTLLGIKVESLKKVENLFISAKYNGVFCVESKSLWWKSRALEILFDLSDRSGLPWERGRGLPDIAEDDYSKCYVSDELYPETVAYIDQSAQPDEAPMKLKYTEQHPDFERMLFFDDIRLMKVD